VGWDFCLRDCCAFSHRSTGADPLYYVMAGRVALTVAGVFYAHLPACGGKAQVRSLEDERRYQRTPEFEAEIEDAGSWHRLVLRLTTQWPLTAIRVTLLGDAYLQFNDSQTGVLPEAPGPRSTAIWDGSHPEQGELQAGDTAVWRIDLGDEQRPDRRPEVVNLRIECSGQAAEDRWTIRTFAELPENPRHREPFSF
jgi:hypothetical protein